MPITMPVPEDYAAKFDAKNPSTYNSHVVATGPYMVKNDAQGNTVGYQAGRSIDLVRNPNWDKTTDYRPAYVDQIQMTTNESDASISATAGPHGLAHDARQRSARRAAARRGDVEEGPVRPGAERRLPVAPLNTTIKPLDNINVRKAIVAAFDREARAASAGGGALHR